MKKNVTALLCFALVISNNAISAEIQSKSELHIGIFPRRNVQETQRLFTPLTQYLAAKLNRKVTLDTPKDFEKFWANVSANKYDIVHYNQYHYVKSAKEMGYRVIAKNIEHGKDTLSGALVIRKDSDIKTIADLRGRKVVFGGGPSAMMSYIVPKHILSKAGLSDNDYKKSYAINPVNAVFAAYFGHTAASGAGYHVLNSPTVREKINTSKLVVLAKSDELPHLPWAVKQNMPAKTKKKSNHYYLT